MNTQQARGRWISVTPDSYVASDDAIGQNYIVAQRVLEEKQDAIFNVMQYAVAG